MKHPYSFQWAGGTQGVSPRVQKFLVFPVIEGKEVFLSDALRYGVVKDRFASQGYGAAMRFPNLAATFESLSPYVKLFFSHCGTRGQQTIQSFYLHLSREDEANVVTITHPAVSSWVFVCRGRFLTRKEILSILSPDNPSIDFLRRERHAPKEFLKRIISIEKPKMVLPKGRRLTLPKPKGG